MRPRCLPGNVEGKQCMTGAACVRESGAGNRPAGNEVSLPGRLRKFP